MNWRFFVQIKPISINRLSIKLLGDPRSTYDNTVIIKIFGHAALATGTARSYAQVAEVVRFVFGVHRHRNLSAATPAAKEVVERERHCIVIIDGRKSGDMVHKYVKIIRDKTFSPSSFFDNATVITWISLCILIRVIGEWTGFME